MKPKHILVPVDLTETSRAGLRMASDLARQFGAALTVVHVEMASTVLSEAMAGHPPIGRPKAGDPTSSREQSGMAGASEQLKAEMLELNLAYQDKFGHVFLICATGRSGEEMRDAVRERIENSPEQEREIVRARLAVNWTLTDIPYRTAGPARYVRVEETGGRLGFITPLTHNFCESCNRVRVTCTGTMYMCLGQEDAADLRTPLRASEGNELLRAVILEGISRKPKGHDFVIDRRHNKPAVRRHMSVTGG